MPHGRDLSLAEGHGPVPQINRLNEAKDITPATQSRAFCIKSCQVSGMRQCGIVFMASVSVRGLGECIYSM